MLFLKIMRKIVYGVYFVKPYGTAKPINNFPFIYRM